MLIKSISHCSRRASIKNLIAYVYGDEHMHNEDGILVSVSSNLVGKRSSWVAQFYRNEKRRKSFYAKGTKSVRLYHEVLSYHPRSNPSPLELEEMMYKYIQLRSGNRPVLAFGSVHWSDHRHCHVVFAGTDFYGKSLRQSRADFRKVQIRMNDFMLEQYPHLSESYIDYSIPTRSPEKRHSHASMERKKRTKQPPIKTRVRKIIEEEFIDSNSLESFTTKLALKNIETYTYRGKLTGVIYEGKKMRLKKTLGIDFQQLLKRDLKQERIARIKALKESKKQDKTKER